MFLGIEKANSSFSFKKSLMSFSIRVKAFSQKWGSARSKFRCFLHSSSVDIFPVSLRRALYFS